MAGKAKGTQIELGPQAARVPLFPERSDALATPASTRGSQRAEPSSSRLPTLMAGDLKLSEQSEDPGFDCVAHGAKFFKRHFSWIGNVPVLSQLSAYEWAFISTSHRRDEIKFDVWELGQRLRSMAGKVITNSTHCLNRLRVDLA